MKHNSPKKDYPVVILCGGKGTRLSEETSIAPKPMVKIGGQPFLWHLMKYYESFGYRHFILCLGYKGEIIRSYVGDLMRSENGWEIVCVDTGEEAMTGARLKRVEGYLSQGRFLLTYGDGLADVDLHTLMNFHKAHGKLGTVTGVHPPSRFGSLHLEGNQVLRFAEKPQTEHDFINGGFFVFEAGFFKYLENDDQCVLERKPLEQLALDGQFCCYRHRGFWQCMDTLRDRENLEEIWRTNPPWRIWR